MEDETIESGGPEISINELFQEFWAKKTVFLWIVLVCLVLGALYTFMRSEEYRAETILVPESNGAASSNLLSQYGGLLGLDAGSGPQTSIFNVDLYPSLIESYPVQIELLERELYFSTYDTTTTLLNFFTRIYQPAPLYYIKKYSVGLSSLEAQYNRSIPDTLSIQIQSESVYDIPGPYRGLISGMKEKIEIFVNTDGTVTISAIMPDPAASAQLVQTVKELLTEHVVRHRTEKANEDLQFVQSQFEQTRQRFFEAQQALAEFLDQNQNIATQRARTEEERLQNEYDIAFTVYSDIATRLEQAKLRVQQATPVFTTLEPAIIPSSPDVPNTYFNIFVSILVGGFFAVLWILGTFLLDKSEFSFKTE